LRATVAKRILLTGSNGMLGQQIHRVLSLTHEVIGVDLNSPPRSTNNVQITGDLTDRAFLGSILKDVKPEMIIHCAAIVNLNTCENEKELTDRLHLDATNQLASFGTPIVFISTDSVFDGKRGNYVETAPTAPLNYYGLSKEKGEEIVRRNELHLILRTNIFGFTCPLKNSLAEWAISKLMAGERISGYTNVYFNSIYTTHLAEIIGKLILSGAWGTFHAASKNNLSKYSFLKYLASRIVGRPDLVVCSELSNEETSPLRPLNPTLNVDKLRTYVDVPSVEEGIDALVDNYLEKLDECN